MASSIYLEVEPNDNCDDLPLRVFEGSGEPRKVAQLRLYDPERPHGLYRVTGWSSEGDGTPCPAYYSVVSDSGAGVAHLIYGGDWGLRLQPADLDEEWDLRSPNQWGEPYLMLSDEADIVLEGGRCDN